MQFSTSWNFNNHKRDKHEMKKDCTFYKQGSCKFPDSCWNRHVIDSVTKTTPKNTTTMECYVCKNSFETKREMMIHRKENHPDKVRQCNNPDNCDFSRCWYLHSNNQSKSDKKVYVDEDLEKYKCDRCNIGFPRNWLVMKHMNDIHKEDWSSENPTKDQSKTITENKTESETNFQVASSPPKPPLSPKTSNLN